MSAFIIELEKRRKKNNWTMAELARQAEVGRPYLYRVMSGEQDPTVGWMQKVAEKIGMKVRIVVG